MKDKPLQALELFGHGLVLILVIALLTGREYSWIPIIIYLVIQVAVMAVDRFRTWHAWPLIVRDWRHKP
jgi:hypothetical protein